MNDTSRTINLATIWSILRDQISDAEVNQLLWDCLGYRYDPSRSTWDTTAVDPEWSQPYPEPPDFMGSRPATVKLTRSIAPEHKQALKEQLGFSGYQVHELTPRLTRRATAANWLLSYLNQQVSQPQAEPPQTWSKPEQEEQA